MSGYLLLSAILLVVTQFCIDLREVIVLRNITRPTEGHALHCESRKGTRCVTVKHGSNFERNVKILVLQAKGSNIQ